MLANKGEGETEEQQERMIDDSLTQLKASEAEAFVSKLEAYAENLDAVTLVSLEEIPHFSHQVKSGCANFDEEVAQKQRMISRSGTTSYNDEYYFGRHWREVSAEGSSAEQQIASAQHDLWDDKVASNQAFEFAGHVVEFEEDQLPLALAGLKTEAAKWYCFEQPAWTPWSREEATVAIQAYAHAHGWNGLQNLKAACPNSKQGIERSKDETLQAVLRWAEKEQIKLRLSVEQVSRRVWFLLDKYSEQQDFTDVVIEDGLVIETSERSLHISQQTTALMVELQADKHLLWVRHNPTYRRLHLALARTKSIAEANQLLMEAYAITQEGKTGLEAKRLSVAQLTALKTRKEVTLSRIRNHPSAPARALLAQVERFAASSKLEGNEFLSQLNQLPLHEQDAVIGKLRSKQIRVTPSETYRSLLADVKGAKEVKANSGKEKWWKGIRWACYERNTPNTEYLQGVQQRYMALPRYEQTAVWQHLNS